MSDIVDEVTGSPLRRMLEQSAAELGVSMKELTVLSAQRDPFRIDTPARHRDGRWLADAATDLGLADREIHLRGLHYTVLGRTKPDGTIYENTAENWEWLSEDAAKAARWLGYIPFDRITDHRNAEPVIRTFQWITPESYITVGVDVDIPEPEDMLPRVDVAGFTGAQPYHLVIFGEKSSLDDVLGPLASEYHADMYLPTGEISDTQIHTMAATGAADGRPMVVFCFSDADPAGWQMPVSIARKLQAFRALLFPDLEYQVRRVGLTPDQVREYGLPSTPLKATEKRADKWRAAMGVEQTEIDALASLRPDLLRRITRDAFAPFYDNTLDRRVFEARGRWLDRAQAVMESQIDSDWMARVRATATEKLAGMRAQIDALNDELRIGADEFRLPVPVVPAAEVTDDPDVYGLPLLDSRWGFAEQTRRLIDSKGYTMGGAA